LGFCLPSSPTVRAGPSHDAVVATCNSKMQWQ